MRGLPPHGLAKGLVVAVEAGKLVGFDVEGEGAPELFEAVLGAQQAGEIEAERVSALHEVAGHAQEQGAVVLDVAQGADKDVGAGHGGGAQQGCEAREPVLNVEVAQEPEHVVGSGENGQKVVEGFAAVLLPLRGPCHEGASPGATEAQATVGNALGQRFEHGDEEGARMVAGEVEGKGPGLRFVERGKDAAAQEAACRAELGVGEGLKVEEDGVPVGCLGKRLEALGYGGGMCDGHWDSLNLSLLSDSNQRPRDYKSRALAN